MQWVAFLVALFTKTFYSILAGLFPFLQVITFLSNSLWNSIKWLFGYLFFVWFMLVHVDQWPWWFVCMVPMVASLWLHDFNLVTGLLTHIPPLFSYWHVGWTISSKFISFVWVQKCHDHYQLYPLWVIIYDSFFCIRFFGVDSSGYVLSFCTVAHFISLYLWKRYHLKEIKQSSFWQWLWLPLLSPSLDRTCLSFQQGEALAWPCILWGLLESWWSASQGLFLS